MFNPKNETIFLINLVKPYRFVVFAILVFLFVASTFDGISVGLFVPLLASLQGAGDGEQIHQFIRWLPQDLSTYSLQHQILILIFFVTLAMILKNVTLAISVRLSAWLSARVFANVKSDAIDLLMSVGIDFHRRSKLGELMGLGIECPSKTREIVISLVHIVAHAITFVVLFGLMFVLSWQLSLISIVLGLGYWGFMTLYMRKLAVLSQEELALYLDTNHRLQESLSGIELIKTYSKESHISSKLYELIDKARRLNISMVFRINGVHWITDILGSVAIGILFLSAMAVYDMNSKVLISRLLPFMYIITRLVPLARMVSQQKTVIVKSWPFFKQIHELLCTDNKPFVPDGHTKFCGLQHVINFKDVSFSYGGDENFALCNLNFAIPKGSTTAFVGQSGSGKTTIVNLLLRFYDPESGKILLDEQPLRDFSLESYHSKISVVSQETFIFHDTVKANIAFGLDELPSEKEIVEAARKAGAHDFVMQLTQGYDTVVGDRGVQLSGGQRQRISIARAVLRDPEILILDEATSSLDNVTERDIHRAIQDFKKNRTVVIVAHRLSTIEHADQIIVLKDGRIVEAGSGKQLLQKTGEYSRLTNRSIEPYGHNIL